MKGGIGDLMRQAQQMKETMKKAQAELATLEVTGEAGGGMANMKTVEGGTLTAKMDGDKVVLIDEKGGGAVVEKADVFQSNGVVHVIDSVLMPK